MTAHSSDKKCVLITGALTGIGRATRSGPEVAEIVWLKKKSDEPTGVSDDSLQSELVSRIWVVPPGVPSVTQSG
jgi:hypothetical protein